MAIKTGPSKEFMSKLGNMSGGNKGGGKTDKMKKKSKLAETLANMKKK